MNDEPRAKLSNRLSKIWQPPDFAYFFEKVIGKPPHTIKKGTLIFNEGDPLGKLYYIKKGFIKLYRLSEEGRDGTSYLLGPGHIVGLRALLSEDESAKHNAEAMTDINVITVSREKFLEHATSNPSLLVDLLHAYIERLDYTEQRLVGFMFTDAQTRVSHFLYDCVKRFSCRKNKTEIALPIKLSHQRISEFVGSFRETVTVVLNKLENEKVIRINNQEITITNLKKLRQFALM